MGYLCDWELQALLADGHIRLDHHEPEDFHPIVIDNVKTVSVDFRLGDFIYRPRAGMGRVLNPADQNSIDAYFGEPEYAQPARKWVEENGIPLDNIPDDHLIFVLQPGEWVLASLMETLGLSANPAISCKMISRSTIGRLAWDAWKETGWIEPGYYGPIGVPISSDALIPNVLLVGLPVAQGLFQRGEAPERGYADIGRYGAVGQDIAKAVWRPSAILPKALRIPMPQ